MPARKRSLQEPHSPVASDPEELADEYFRAQDLLDEAGDAMGAKRALSELVSRAPSTAPRGYATVAELQLLGGHIPPSNVIFSAAHNKLGEILLDEAIEAGFPTQNQNHRQAMAAAAHFSSALRLFPDNPAPAMSLATIHRDCGRVLSALEVLAHLADLKHPGMRHQDGRLPHSNEDECQDGRQQDSWMDDWVWASAQRSVPIANMQLAVLLSQLGRHQEAAPIIGRFFKQSAGYRIAPGVWDRVCTGAVGGTNSRAPVKFFQDCIPEHLYKPIMHTLHPTSPYWTETAYDSREYFSFFVDLADTSLPSSSNQNAIEDLIKNHLLPLTGRRDLVGAEWWVHTRLAGRNLGHQLHYDFEEGILEATGQVYHPAVSSVVYLSGAGSAAGPTLIMDQCLPLDTNGRIKSGVEEKDSGMAERGWLVQPLVKGFMTFPGNLLHGVLPGQLDQNDIHDSRSSAQRRAQLQEPPPPREHRLTLMVAWWDRETNRKVKRRMLGPQSPMPRSSRSVTWPDMLQVSREDQLHKKRAVQACVEAPEQVLQVGPVWEAVSGELADRAVSIPHQVDPRFFLRHASDIQNRLVEEHCS